LVSFQRSSLSITLYTSPGKEMLYQPLDCRKIMTDMIIILNPWLTSKREIMK